MCEKGKDRKIPSEQESQECVSLKNDTARVKDDTTLAKQDVKQATSVKFEIPLSI